MSRKAKPPKPLEFSTHEPLADYYCDGDGNLYSVARLVDMAKDLEPFDLPLAGIDLSGKIWDDADMYMLAWHVKAVAEADLSFPVILAWNGAIADGRHRIIKALIQGKSTIKAVRITWRPDPCKPAEG